MPQIRIEDLGQDGLRTLVESTADGILLVDGEGTICYANRAACDQLGRGAEQLVGSAFGVPLVAGEKTEIETPMRDGSIGVRELRVARTRINTDDDVFLVSLRDVTDRRQMELARERAREEAEATARTRSSLLNMVAHEFRSPLSVISGYLSLIQEGELGEIPQALQLPMQKTLEKVQELRRMVDDVLMAARLEAGRLGTEAQPLDLRDVARAAIRRAAGRGELLRAQLKVDLPAEPVPVSADPGQIGIILDNLINNAFSYSRGEPWVEVQLERADGRALLRVSDHGIGIARELRNQVFERFRRLGGTSNDGQAGTGLGLAISRDLARLNGGLLTLARSEPGEGSTFVLELPIKAQGSPAS